MAERKGKIQNLVAAVRYAYRGYRKVADPVLPIAQRVVDPTALIFGANTILAETIYHAAPRANQALEYLVNNHLGPNAYDNVVSFFQNHPDMASGGKKAALLALFGAFNYYLVPKFIKMYKGERIPSKYLQMLSDRLPDGFHHARTLATLVAMLAVWHLGNFGQDVKRIGGKIVDVVTDEELHRYLSGEKAHKIFADISDLFDIEAYRVPIQVSREVETELNRAENRKPDVQYIDQVSRDAAMINRKGVKITPEQLAYLARVGYFEATFDNRAGKDPKKILDGVHAVSHVIKNRWEFENKVVDGTFGRKNREDTIFDVAFHHGTKTRGNRTYTVWQFTCIRDHPKYFYEHRGKKSWNMYEGGNINVAVGFMDPVRAQLAYQGVVDVLSGKVPDPTGKSLYYQNPKFADKYNRNWDEKLDKVTQINSHVFYKFKEGSTQGPHASFIESPKSQKYEVPQAQKAMLAYAKNNTLLRRRLQRIPC